VFIGALKVGSHTKQNVFNVIFDTGSALTCINSKRCNDIGCKRAHQYDRARSTTF
jgi:cathepsin D